MPSPENITICLLPDRPDRVPAGAYDIYLVNRSGVAMHVDFQWLENGKKQTGRKLLMGHGQVEQVHHIWLDNLNESPAVQVHCWLAEKRPGIEPAFKKTLKLKAKTVLKPLASRPEFAAGVHELILWDVLPKVKTVEARTLNKQLRTQQQPQTQLSAAILRKANLRAEIDLHAEALGINPRELSSFEVVQLQLKAFEEWMNDVIRHGFDTVYAIHGDGKGTLKKLIHQELEAWPHVTSFNNNYHPKYGTGATEIHID